MEETRMKNSLWVGYVLLFLFSFALYWGVLLGAGAAALILACYLRGSARKAERAVECAHAQWQMNTVWLTLLLAVLGVAGVVGIAAWMGSDPATVEKLDALSPGSQPPLEMLQQFWAVPGSKAFVGTLCGWLILFLVWPLKRTVQGMLALRQRQEPANSGSACWLALALGVLLQIGIPMIFLK